MSSCIASKAPACCSAETTLPEVARLMVEHDCGAIPVTDDDLGKQIVGMVTDRDIVTRTIAERRNPLDLRARDVMTPNTATVRQEADLNDICRVMEERQVRRIPVVDADGNCVGIISQADLARKGPDVVAAEVVKEVSQSRAVWM